MTPTARPARTGIQTCKVFRPIDRRLSNSTRRTQVRTDDKGLIRHICQYAGAAVYPVGSPKRLSQRSAARLAGSGEGCHLQGNGGGSA